VDESTDTWDAIDWLVKNIPGNNGKVGIVGISYPGWLALAGAVDPHAALKAASEQACMGDLFLGDDFHHNGAFRLSYGFEYSYNMEYGKSVNIPFPFPAFDLYDWYLGLGSLANVNKKYFENKVPTWNDFEDHPNYDAFWQKNSPLNYVKEAEVPMLHVGGYFDQEDINGPQQMYVHMEKANVESLNYMVLGPWNHGQWGDSTNRLGQIIFDSYTTEWFKTYQKKWFDYWLKNIGESKFEEAWCFQTGINEWKSYATWPPKEAVIQKLYAGPGNTCSFEQTNSNEEYAEYVSDPGKPVPYRTLPIEMTYGRGSRWDDWHVEDQRFVYTRPDVLSFKSEPLFSDLTVTGNIIAHLFASTSGTDADWIVKLIDVYPDFYDEDVLMSGYMLPIAMEVFRGRYRKSFSDPSPLIPRQPEEFTIDLHQVNHVFRKGHRLMIQVQSTWFPIIDRNPQKFVPNIFKAKESDFIKATHRVYFSEKYPTYIELPVLID
ncbi:MAG TPA: CocE/NonD family hydrolase, partial [Cyclobacteriaceae bacterium]|nr:CocE/NonD family hydrolase [Cyclobacteriaceae bacterium]